MNGNNFQEFPQILSRLNQSSIIVLNNALYHSVKSEDTNNQFKEN